MASAIFTGYVVSGSCHKLIKILFSYNFLFKKTENYVFSSNLHHKNSPYTSTSSCIFYYCNNKVCYRILNCGKHTLISQEVRLVINTFPYLIRGNNCVKYLIKVALNTPKPLGASGTTKLSNQHKFKVVIIKHICCQCKGLRTSIISRKALLDKLNLILLIRE
ncbi:hypothetical protein RINTHM_11310 [Richelia intracellularis HM01]|nr:hypothetical protein RINTHM_11310 [Richelia intracellularis HM01]